MSKKNKNEKENFVTEEVLDSLNNTATNSEKFIEKNARPIAIGFGVILLAAFAYFAYVKFAVEPKNEEAYKEMTNAQLLFFQDSLDASLKGNGGNLGFNEIIENYSGTDAANLANYYAGIALYEKGEYENAVEKFKSFSSDDEVLNSVSKGAIGDCYVGLGKKDEALSQFESIAQSTNNAFIAYNFYKKAGLLAMSNGDNKKALKCFSTIKEKYPEESEGFPDVDAYIEMLTYKDGNN
ncbi:MAG: tetratricopeptide repeat protein [Flavobacteriales bacterium]|nr:tetratricopeptide repeat protein [Flavobacteriales bacterium]